MKRRNSQLGNMVKVIPTMAVGSATLSSIGSAGMGNLTEPTQSMVGLGMMSSAVKTVPKKYFK